MMSKQLEAARKGLPEAVIKLLDKLPPEDQITWIEDNRGTFSKQAATVPATPAPVNDRQTSQAEDAKARAKVGAFVRSSF
jgi:hypothetical protein